MIGYSLSFFANGRYDQQWWDKITPEIAEKTAERARAAGCEPNDLSRVVHGVATSWVGPSMGVVLANLTRLDAEKSRGAE